MNRQTPDRPRLSPPPAEDERRRQRWWPLLLLLLVPVCLWLVSQIALFALGINEVNESLLSRLRADYSTWQPAQFNALNPQLIGTIRADQLTFAAGVNAPNVGLIPFVPGETQTGLTQISELSTFTPTAQPTATQTQTSVPTSTAIVLPPLPTATSELPSGTATTEATAPAATPPTLPPPPPPPTSKPTPIPTSTADLRITKVDDVLVRTTKGQTIHYAILATNNGPDPVTKATVKDSFPSSLTSISWTCIPGPGASCPASGTGNIGVKVNLQSGSSVLFIVTATVAPTATSGAMLTNKASITPPAGVSDPKTINNTATAQFLVAPVVDVLLTWNSPDNSTTADLNLSVTDASGTTISPASPGPVPLPSNGELYGATSLMPLTGGTGVDCGTPVQFTGNTEEALWAPPFGGPVSGPNYSISAFYYVTCTWPSGPIVPGNERIHWDLQVKVDGAIVRHDQGDWNDHVGFPTSSNNLLLDSFTLPIP